MPDRSTEYFDPFIIAERGRSYKGIIPLSQLDRLKDSIIDDRGEVHYALCFAKEDKVYTVAGQIGTELVLECSVCLDKMFYPVEAHTKLGMISSLDDAARLSEAYEPLLVVDRQLRIKEIIEDELLLAIPITPRHPECRVASHGSQTPIHKMNNPFSILEDLKSRGDQ